MLLLDEIVGKCVRLCVYAFMIGVGLFFAAEYRETLSGIPPDSTTCEGEARA
jgi:hypothetical protein